jgi:hypothetical protein
LVEHYDLVAVFDGGEAVRHYECGALLQGLQRVLDVAFSNGVQRGGGFVEDEDIWVADEAARDAQALLLAA